MPTYDDRKRTINYYGVFALWASILLLGSYFLLFTSGCDEEIASLEIQISLAITFIIGIILFLLSFCNFAVRIYHMKFLFYLVVIILGILSLLLLYISYQTLGHKCSIGRFYERNYQLFHNFTTTPNKKAELDKTLRSIHQSRNNHYLASAILDLLAALLYGGSAHAFRNRF